MTNNKGGTVTLSTGERVIRDYPYQVTTGKNYAESSCLVMTNKRLIHRNVITQKDKTTTYTSEVPIADADSVETTFYSTRKPIHLIIKFLFFFLAFMGAVFMFLGFFTKINIPSIIGAVFLSIGIVILIISLCLSKKTYFFALKSNRLSYMRTANHLDLNNSSFSKNQARKTSEHFKPMKILFILPIAFLGIFWGVLFGNAILKGEITTVLRPLILLAFFIVLLLITYKPNRKQNKTVNRAQNKMMKLEVTINPDVVTKLVNEIGALIYDCKNKNLILETTETEEL